MSNPFEDFVSSAQIMQLFERTSVLQAMLDFESALSRAQARLGLIPAHSAEVIARLCVVDRVDVDAIAGSAARAGSIAIPLVKALTRAVAAEDEDASHVVHLGSTSQDVQDTAMVLLTRRAVALIDSEATALAAELRRIALEHRATPILARTLMQPAGVTSLGYKAAIWAGTIIRGRNRVRRAAKEAFQLQLGGAIGTLGTFGSAAKDVVRETAFLLQLDCPDFVWHTARDNWIALAAEVGVLVSSCAKIAGDWALLSQAEVGEISEPVELGRGGSSALPHKRNPVSCMIALAAGKRVPARISMLLSSAQQEHERGLGNWHAEMADWASVLASTHSALAALSETAQGLNVNAVRMRENIAALRGLASSERVVEFLAKAIGRPDALLLTQRLSARVLDEGIGLQEVVAHAIGEDAELRGKLSDAELASLFDLDLAVRPAAARTDEALEFFQRAFGFESCNE